MMNAITWNTAIGQPEVKRRGRVYRVLAVAIIAALLVVAAVSAVRALIPRRHAGIPVISSVSGVSSDDVWAVGGWTRDPAFSSPDLGGLIEHWNGSNWSLASFPAPAHAIMPSFTAISADSHNDVWAIGSYRPSENSPASVSLVERWNGSHWTIIPAPPVRLENTLAAVDAIGHRDV
jgi:hypothetical protein